MFRCNTLPSLVPILNNPWRNLTQTSLSPNTPILFFQILWSPNQANMYGPDLRPYILLGKVDTEIYSLCFSQLDGIPFTNNFQGKL